MKIPLSWLRKYLDFDCDISQLTERMTMIGIEVESVEDPAKAMTGFVVGHVVSCNKHPDADKLNVTIVDTGREKLQVVCGAPNCRQGMKGVFAPVGSYIPGLDVTLKKASIRGQESNGMLCSERELLLSDEHKGIIELPDDAIPGTAAAAALGLDDPIIDISITPNRGDHAGVYGLARDLAASGIGTLKALHVPTIKGEYKNPVSISIETPACSLFIGRHIRGVKNGPSPAWLQKCLKAAGLRPISALVDITNYFALGLCRPLHVFDARKLKGNITVRMARKGEKLDALNDKTYELSDDMITVCDTSGVLGLGGIIGGAATGCDETTTDVFLECAIFDPGTIARTGRALMINSDARYRFERGVDPAFAENAVHLATQMILDLCGGTASEITVAGKVPDNRRHISYPLSYVRKIGGVDVPPETQISILEKLGFTARKTGDSLDLTTPSWRPDVEGKADIVEEILRIYGFDQIEAKKPESKTFTQRILPQSIVRATAMRHGLAARGLAETITWSFMASDISDLFGANQNQKKAELTLTNPISTDLSVMRPSILPNLIAAAGQNFDRGYPDAALFEIGNIYRDTSLQGQIMTATGLRAGNALPRHWSGPVRPVDTFDAKADALAALEMCGVPTANIQITRDAPEWYHPGRSGVLRLGPTALAYFGEIHPGILQKLKREEAYAGFEVFLPHLPLAKNKGPQKQLLQLSPFQPVVRDFAFIADAGLDVEKLIRAIRGCDKTMIGQVEIFDVYQGPGVAEGKKSIALGVTFQPADKTLTDADITALYQKVIAAAQSIGCALRQ